MAVVNAACKPSLPFELLDAGRQFRTGGIDLRQCHGDFWQSGGNG
jgi:hypothetical protein